MNTMNDTLATMLTITQLPSHLQGDFYNNIINNSWKDEDEEVLIPHPIKTDFVFETHDDIINMINTCAFCAVDLPDELFRYVEENPDILLSQSAEYQANVASKKIEESFFVTTYEYQALILLAQWQYTDIQYKKCYHLAAHAIKNDSVVLLQYVIRRHVDQWDPFILRTAVEHGKILCIDFLVKYYRQHTKLICVQTNLCEKAKTFTVLKYLRETLRFEWDKRVIKQALYDNCIERFEYALKNGCPVDLENAATVSLRLPKIDAFRLLVELAGYKPVKEDVLYASALGSINHLVYIDHLNTPWHPQAVNTAARFKHHSCMEFGIQCGAPYDPNFIELAYLPFREDIDRWMANLIYQNTV
jgi:hypothetical protein